LSTVVLCDTARVRWHGQRRLETTFTDYIFSYGLGRPSSNTHSGRMGHVFDRYRYLQRDMNGLQHGAYLAKSCACNMFIQLLGRCAADGFVSFLLTSFIKTIGWEGGMSYDGMKFVLRYTCVGCTFRDCIFPSRTCRCLVYLSRRISHQSRSRQDRRRCFHLHPLIFSRRSA
jgi:hypothetical protein